MYDKVNRMSERRKADRRQAEQPKPQAKQKKKRAKNVDAKMAKMYGNLDL